ncbi:hypothetical protein G5V57_24160 [Nordella sp. HKS 07]|uniref:hypothetical protein n=1 Tax=Nordella sp. HKS 07 TaxID=2712222 RepID=UPI0013E1ACCC|nr:hypothetical protein [Nordella sp. HKS 07]QIG50549.1 hypothetical protein G5V57_24160 [Nordella sp. HKS 07]
MAEPQIDAKIFIEFKRIGRQGPLYAVYLAAPDGEEIVAATIQPMYDASRVLLERGITGTLEMWDSERPYPRMRGDIAGMANWTIRENRKEFRLVRYQKMPSASDVFSPAAKQGSGVSE